MRFRQHQEEARRSTRWLLLAFACTVALTVVAANAALALIWWLPGQGALPYPNGFFATNTAVVLLLVLGGCWLEMQQLRQGGARVLQQVGGREVSSPSSSLERRLLNVVEEMAIASGIKRPTVLVLDGEAGINALAAGWEQHDSAIAVTRGSLERLSRDELQGVVAHEMAHIVNGDTRLNMRLLGMVYGLQLLHLMGRDLMTLTDARGRRSFTVVLGLALMLVGALGWMAGRLLQAAVSRQREFLADASAVQFTRLPAGLGQALRKAAGLPASDRDRLAHPRGVAVAHMLLHSAWLPGALLATHPPLAQRLARIYSRPMEALSSTPATEAPEEASAPAAPGAAGGHPPATPLAALPFVEPGVFTPDFLPHTPAPAADPARPGAAPASPSAANGAAHPLLTRHPAAALLALLVAPGHAADPAAETRAWQQAVEGDGISGTDLLSWAWALPAGARTVWLESLLQALRTRPDAERERVCRHALAIARADGRLSHTEVWYSLAVQAALLPRPVHLLREPDHLGLAQLAAEAGVVVQALSAHQPTPELQALWRAHALTAAGLAPTDGTPHAAEQAAPSVTELAHALRALHRLSRVQRPRLLKALASAHAAHPHTRNPGAVPDALRCLCLIIDTPVPPLLTEPPTISPAAETWVSGLNQQS